ncbi:MAG: hypothetical protein A3H34_05000 [Betaproteobacteria bacterium RIFCSPLOWO2_02_FULL_67_19]|nr:MAG: hypothetical protein A3H34_05000 [Betaproteobacteria bacterium RIFCSPLOWO2_02_FULL_67_19]
MIRNFISAAMLAAALGTLATPSAAEIVVQIGPPQLLAEITPALRRGHIWVAGHWDWKNRQHQWVDGHWIRERHGYRYDQPSWMEREGSWHMQRGGWRLEDRDGDGVPNRRDRAPDDPNRS